MRIGVIDAELLGRKKHRFPNLASMKLSAWHKQNGDYVKLLENYDEIYEYDKVYISKVFTSTPINDDILNNQNIIIGGTGFYYDKAPPLPNEIEHIMPDYHLYDNWVSKMLNSGVSRSSIKYYTDYDIGFLTRGCFRQCSFCVNQHYKQCVPHSNINEFISDEHKKICLLDDNFFACPTWKQIIDPIKNTEKPFQFKQGLDERLLSYEKITEMMSWKYDGEFIFAFDNIEDYQIIEHKLKIIRSITNKTCKFYVLCGYDRQNSYTKEFWQKDIIDTFKRIELLGKYGCIPYIMRYEKYEDSPYRGTHINLAMWCNLPQCFKKMSYESFCKRRDERVSIPGTSAPMKAYKMSLNIPDIVQYLNKVLYIEPHISYGRS